jgi:hypothetical protein
VLTPSEPAESPLFGQPVGAHKLIEDMARLGLDAGEISAETGLDGSGVQEDGTWQPEFEGQRPPFEPANSLGVRHGAHSERQIVRRATVEKRRLLRQIGLRQADLGSVGQALLLNWAQSAGALHLLDEYAQREGWLDEEGNPLGFATLYVRLLNADAGGAPTRVASLDRDRLRVLLDARHAARAPEHRPPRS